MKYEPFAYQVFAEKHVIQNPFSGLLLEMSLGKTAIMLTAIDKLMNYNLEISKPLVIAPKRVAEVVWQEEIDKWEHLQHLKLSIVSGTEKERIAALKKQADIYAIGRDNVAWLVKYYMTAFPFDMLVIDESSSFKSPKAQRFKSLRMVRPKVKRSVILTGTPTPNGLVDMWAQMFLVDQGERLEKHVTEYRRKYFEPAKTNGHTVYSYSIKKDAEQVIYKKISDVCISMKTRDYLDLPESRINDIKVRLSDEQQKKYDQFEATQVLKLLEQDDEISALNAAALTNKLLQYANGAIYDSKKQWHEVHDHKLNALEEVYEAAQGKPMLVAYSYKHDMERILNKFSKARFLSSSKDIADWNKGLIEMAVTHPASTGHGLNLQAGGSILTWFGLTWSSELYKQFNARIERIGQKAEFILINRIICYKTMDNDVIRAIDRKVKGQDALMEAVKAIIQKYRALL